MPVLKSRYKPVDIPLLPAHKILFDRIKQHGDQICCVDAVTEEFYRFSDILLYSRRIASGLVKLGVKKGDVIALYSPNTVNYVVMFYGAICSGAVITTANHLYTKDELVHQLNDCKAKYIYTSSALAQKTLNCKSECSSLQAVIADGSHPGCVSLDQLMCDDGLSYPQDLQIDVHNDLFSIVYSSGTTGTSKGVMLTHHNLAATLMQFCHPQVGFPFDKRERSGAGVVLVTAPFCHIYGMNTTLLNQMSRGAKLVLTQKFNPTVFLETIQKYKILMIPATPPLVLFLAKSPLVQQYDVSSVKYMTCGAAPLSRDLEQEIKTKLNLNIIKQGYGMTETGAGGVTVPSDKVKVGSVGWIMPNSEAKVVDVDTGAMLGPYQRGELCLRGPHITRGYYNRPRETRELIDVDGWMHTGDIVYFDDDEYFYIVDRMKELIKVKGYQVAPAELEGLLLSHSGILDCAVTGVPDERAGELPRAYVVRHHQSANLTEQQVQDYVADKLARYKWLDGGVVFVDEIPKSENGKILRRKLKERALQEMRSKL